MLSIPLEAGIFFVSCRRFDVFRDRFRMKSEWDCIMHRNDITSSLFLGGPACWSASTFVGSGLIPSLVTRRPQNGISCLVKMHLSELRVSPEFWIICNIVSSVVLWLSNDLVPMITSSWMSSWMTWTPAMLPNNGRSVFVSSPDAGLAPIVSLRYRFSLLPAWKTVMYRDDSSISNWWKADLKSSLLKYFAPANLTHISSARGIGMLSGLHG